MNVLCVFILLAFGTVEVLSVRGDHLSIMCYSCHHVDDPSHCTTVERCWAGGHCGVDATTVDGILEFQLGCFEAKACDNPVELIGKRARGHHDQHVCRKCCDGATCNKYLCSGAAVNHIVNTTPRPTPVPTIGQVTGQVTNQVQVTSQPGPCVDHDTDGFACNIFDKHICTETDPTRYAYILAHSKCPQYCGFCTDQVASSVYPSVAASTDAVTVLSTALVCQDDPDYDCASFDLFHFCKDNTSFAWPVAVEKCPRHCGFCTEAVQPTAALVDGPAASVATDGPVFTPAPSLVVTTFSEVVTATSARHAATDAA